MGSIVGRKPARAALLIGVDRYESRDFADLDFSEKDVDEVAVELKAIGFDKVVVMKGSNEGKLKPTLKNIEIQLNSLFKDLRERDIALVALSGHGLRLRTTATDRAGDKIETDESYFCPVDAAPNDPNTMLSLHKLTRRRLGSRGVSGLVLIDACHEKIFTDPIRNERTRGIDGSSIAPPDGCSVLLSCSSGQVSLESRDKKHGVFAVGLLEAFRDRLPEDPISWPDLVERVRERVVEINPNQEPTTVGKANEHLIIGSRLRNADTRNPDVVTMKSTGIELRRIPSGTFMMGTNKEETTDIERVYSEFTDDFKRNVWLLVLGSEHPRRKVRISKPFYIGTTEVTRGQFAKFVKSANYLTEVERNGKGGSGWHKRANESDSGSQYTWQWTGFDQNDDHPVVNVTWRDAIEFCNWQSVQEGRRPFYRIDGDNVSVPDWNADGIRLPTEAEWEYACRGLTTTRYVGGDDPESIAKFGNVADEAYRKQVHDTNTIQSNDGFVFTAPVGRFQSNRYGLKDMQGNVWEWCWDLHDHKYYESLSNPAIDPRGSETTLVRSNRGGCWNSGPRKLRSAVRNWFSPKTALSILGFRVAASTSAASYQN
jgi:formylglycine-generating enzyme required for sulfatase activity